MNVQELNQFESVYQPSKEVDEKIAHRGAIIESAISTQEQAND